MSTFSQVTYQLPHITLQGIEAGDPTKPTLLCLHGWLDNAASYEPLIPFLTDYHVIAIDWPGHGLSDHRSKDAYYHFIDWLSDLHALFTQNKWQAIDVVGHSMGGMIATAFCAAFPEFVGKLTLIDSIGFLTEKPDNTTKQLRAGIISRANSKNKQKNIHPTIDSAIAARVSVSDFDETVARFIVKRGTKPVSGGVTWSSDSRLRLVSPYRFTFEQAKKIIQDIQIPVQLVYGDQGSEMVKRGISVYGDLFPEISCYPLVGGHHVHMEKAEQTANLIKSFHKINA